MSWDALNWAVNQKTGSASGKIVLLLMANHASEHGASWVGLARLAKNSEQSVDSVQRRINELVELQLLRRIKLRQQSGRIGENFFLLACSPHFSKRVDELGWLLPSMYVCDNVAEPKNVGDDTAGCVMDQSATEGRRSANQSANQSANGPPYIIESLESYKPGGGDESGAINPKTISAQAGSIADEIMVIAGVDPKNPVRQWCGAALVVEGLLREKYTRDQLIAGARECMSGKRDGPPHSIKYFFSSFQRMRANAEAPAPQPSQVTHATNRNGAANGFASGGESFSERALRLARLAAGDFGSGS